VRERDDTHIKGEREIGERERERGERGGEERRRRGT
jgi:hypothetical protein